MFRFLYGVFAYLGVLILPAAFLLGFRHEPGAPIGNLYFNVIIYALFIAVHIVMTMPALKRLLFGNPEGSPVERRIYVAISILSWLAVYVLHKPVGGFGFESPVWLQFVGVTAVLLGVVSFFEFATFESLGSLLGMPGAEVSHTAGAETPLMTEGPYASVRHPMYRAAVGYALASLLIHPNACQLLFAVMVGASFLGFIPFEESQLVRHRGEDYERYRQATPYRVLNRIW